MARHGRRRPVLPPMPPPVPPAASAPRSTALAIPARAALVPRRPRHTSVSRRLLRGPRIRSARGGGGRIPFLPLIIALVVLFAAGLGGAQIVASAASPAPSPPPTPAAPGTVDQWIAQAEQALEAAGTPASALNTSDIKLIIEHEDASLDPRATNNWDSNAAAGHPSIGLMQCIISTFEAHRLSSLPDDIYDPVANIAAGVRYAISNYGSLDQVPGVAAVHAGGRYVGY